ncbi:hypothetical protein BLSTO_01068 [Blastocystis sp. subtype 1]
MSQRDGLYTILSEKIVRLNEELIRFTREAESVQSVIEKASTVSTLYADMFRNTSPLESTSSEKPSSAI